MFTLKEYLRLLLRPVSLTKLIAVILARQLFKRKRRNEYSETVYTSIALMSDRRPKTKRTIMVKGVKRHISEDEWPKYEQIKFQQIGALISKELASIEKPRILEIGVGEGGTMGKINHSLRNADVTKSYEWHGCDLTFPRLNNFRAEMNVKLVNTDGKKLPYRNDFFDLVYTHNVLEQIPRDFGYVIDEALRVSKKYLCMEPGFEYADLDGKLNILMRDHLVGLESFISKNYPKYKRIVPEAATKAKNPTMYYVINREDSNNSRFDDSTDYLCPRTGQSLVASDNTLETIDGKYCYPIVNGIPLLKDKYILNIEKNSRKEVI